MLKILLIIFPVIVFLFQDMNAQTLSASHSGLGITIDVLVDVSNDKVHIVLTGPSDSWFAYGFGDTGMDGTYAIISENKMANQISERNLGDHNEGTLLSSSFNSSVFTDDGGSRTIIINMNRVAIGSDYFTFPNSESIISFIYANGPQAELAYHLSSNKGSGTANTATGLAFSSVLPVVWSNFVLVDKEGRTFLSWQTESEIDNLGFTVQRSKDAREWTDLHFIEAQNENGSEYSYLDESTLPGVNYYRLKQTDLVGTINYSVVKSIEIGGRGLAPEINVFPNPVGDFLKIEVEGNQGQKRVQILNSNYQILKDVPWKVENKKQIDMTTLPAGHYILSVRSMSWTANKFIIKK